jgi:hypothetical protein
MITGQYPSITVHCALCNRFRVEWERQRQGVVESIRILGWRKTPKGWVCDEHPRASKVKEGRLRLGKGLGWFKA